VKFLIKFNVAIVTFILFIYPIIQEVKNFKKVKKLFYNNNIDNRLDLFDQLIFYSIPYNNLLFIFFVIAAIYFFFINFSKKKINKIK